MSQLLIDRNSSRFNNRRRAGGINTSAIGLVLLGITIIASLIVVIRNVLAIERPDKTVIRIAHWQLEAGYREAFDKIIAEYEILHPGVHVVQMPVTEKLYAQWINTQMISGTAPDLVEVGQSSVITKDENTVRYFLPLGDYVDKPNPYNDGTELEGVPWKETFIDGMRGGYRETLQDYYMAPTAMIGMRLFVNTDLLEKATGSRELPKTLGDFLEKCQKVRDYGLEVRKPQILPLVSGYAFPTIFNAYQVPFMAQLESLLDWDLDGVVMPWETYRGLLTDRISLETPNIKGFYLAMRQICEQMQTGFTSMDRQMAMFNFVNGNSAFYYTGSWDAQGVFVLAGQKGIDVKLMRWPMPGKGEPYADLIAGQPNEAASRGASPYGIYKHSTNRKQALDFLYFITSRDGNEKLNKYSQWPPIVIGAEPDDRMKPFMPSAVGFSTSANLSMGSKLGSALNSFNTDFVQGDISLEELSKRYTKAMEDPRAGGDYGMWYDIDRARRDVRNQDRLMAREIVEKLMDPAGSFDASRYQRALLQQVRRNNGREMEHRFELFRGKTLPEF